MKLFLTTIALTALAGTMVSAQSGLTAGNVGISYEHFGFDGAEGQKLSVFGNGSFDITPRFGVQAGASYGDFDSGLGGVFDSDLHLYSRFGSAKVGVFGSYLTIPDVDADGYSYGLEAMFRAGGTDIEARIGQMSIESLDTTFAGIDFYHTLSSYSQGLTLAGGLEYSELAGVDIYEISAGLDYRVANNINLSGRLGYLYLTDSFDDADGLTAGVALTYEFGQGSDRQFRKQNPFDVFFASGI